MAEGDSGLNWPTHISRRAFCEHVVEEKNGAPQSVRMWAKWALGLLDEIESAKDMGEHWEPIQTLPPGDTVVMAYVPDGRMMIWPADLLLHAMSARIPEHLKFPATHWRRMPHAPALQPGAQRREEDGK